MEVRKLKGLSGAVFVVAMASGPSACRGGGAEVRSEVTTTTKGKQLMDPQMAFESDALTKEEYAGERNEVLKT